LIGIFDEDAKLGDRELDQVGLVEHALGDGVDALKQQGHGGGVVDQIGEGLHQLLRQPWLQRSESCELKWR